MSSMQDLLMLVLAIAVGWVAVFLCWALYEIAKLVRQANIVVSDAREKITRVERIALSIKDKLENSVNYLGLLAEGGKALLSFVMNRDKEEKEEKKGKKRKSELFDEEEG